MNTIVTSKEEILKNSRELIREKGWAAVSIRSVASACGVSVGSIYNYYDSKAELISATVESVWCEIFHRPQDEAVFQDVQTCVKWMYERMAYGCEQYPGFFTLHSLGFMQEDKADGKRHMQQVWHHILNGLCTVLQQDSKIRPGAFNEQFTVEKFADVLFSLMLSALLRQDYDPAAVLEIVRDARELIRLKVLESSMYNAREASVKLAEATGADCVQVIGSKFVLYLQKKKDSAYADLLK